MQALSQLSYTPDLPYLAPLNLGSLKVLQIKEGAILKTGRRLVNDFFRLIQIKRECWLTTNVRLCGELQQVHFRLWLPTRLAMLSHHISEDAATHIELGSDAHKFGLGRSD